MKILVHLLLTALLAVSSGFSLRAEDAPKSLEAAQALASSLKYQQGEVVLGQGLATLRVPAGMRYLNGTDANTVLTRLWGNPPSDEPLGLLVPDGSVLSNDAWAVIITYDEDGYVKDEDAGKIDYDKLLNEMQKDTRTSNKARVKQGYEGVELVGWATKPHYDAAAKKLYWAKELKFGDAADHTLNYDIRILGRRGVLNLRAVSALGQLREIEEKTPAILAAIDFNPGHRYADFSEAAGDKVAKYGIGALIAGGVAAKLGLFKGLWLAVLGLKKFAIIGVAALIGVIRKLFRGKTAQENS